MSAKHTPGPWHADTAKCYGFPSKLTPNIAINPIVMGRPVNIPIAKVPRCYSDAEANARLIAAAPELLEALQALLADAGVDFIRSRHWDAARAAIAKATGEKA